MKNTTRPKRQSEDAYRAVVESTSDSLYLVDKNCRYLFINSRHLSRLGLPAGDIIGRPYGEFHSPEETKNFTNTIKDVVTTGKSVQYEHQSWRDNRYFLRTFSPVQEPGPDGKITSVAVVSKDITERKQTEKALQESEELYRVLAEKSFAGVYVVQNGKFRFINSNAASYAGYTPGELIGRESIKLVHPEDREQFKKNAIEMLYGKRTFPYEYRIITREGQIKWLMEMVSSIIWEGRRAVLGNSMDLTDRKRTEEEIRSISVTDQLTGLFNRRGFLTLAEQQLKFSDRHQSDMLLFFADLDGMKWINDTLGHEEGDRALIDVAGILKETFRSSDIIARMGGDEFAILAIDTTGIYPEVMMTRVQNQIDKHNNEGIRRYKISISMGTAYYDPESPCSFDKLMSRADQLMYEQKKNKKSRPAQQ